MYDDRATFYPALTAFTADGDNSRFTADIAYNNAGEIEVSLGAFSPSHRLSPLCAEIVPCHTGIDRIVICLARLNVIDT